VSTPARPAPPEPILEPELPICDAHHHLWKGRGHTGFPYLLADLQADTATGHNVVQTVFVECHAEYRKDGPEHLRPVGEVEFVAAAAEDSARTGGSEITGIVGHADLTLGDAVEEVLHAEEEAGRGRFRGIRFTTAWDASPMGNNAGRAGLMGEETYRRGVHKLGALGMSYDVMCYHTQLLELADLARACPEVTFVANHLGVPIAGGPYKGKADEVRAVWQKGLRELATCENVVLKIGALIRPLTGEKWDRSGQQPTSEEVVAAWGPEIRFAIEQFGPSRCLFESNFPVDKACVGYVQLWNAFKRIAADLSPDEKRDLFHDTAARAYRLATLG
jgi:predicted TIM-barrel fold metal-dependent hydrolase